MGVFLNRGTRRTKQLKQQQLWHSDADRRRPFPCRLSADSGVTIPMVLQPCCCWWWYCYFPFVLVHIVSCCCTTLLLVWGLGRVFSFFSSSSSYSYSPSSSPLLLLLLLAATAAVFYCWCLPFFLYKSALPAPRSALLAEFGRRLPTMPAMAAIELVLIIRPQQPWESHPLCRGFHSHRGYPYSWMVYKGESHEMDN